MKDKKKLMILAIVLLLAIGFAAVSTTLILNGSLGIGTNKADFDVRFIAAKVNDVDVSSTAISEDGKTITYEVELENANSRADLDYTILNNSSQYDANVSVVCGEGLENDPYVVITSSLSNEVIKAGESLAGTVRVDLKKSALEEVEDKLLHCDIEAVAVEKGINE